MTVRLNSDEMALVMRAWEDGRSATDIAKEVGISRFTLARILREAGVEVKARYPVPTGPDHHLWKGGRTKMQGGYIAVHVPIDSPYAVMGHRRHLRDSTPSVYVFEHRLVMAQKIGRPLLSTETVHHIDGDPSNNDPANLELRVGRHGKGATGAHCATCICFTVIT